MSAWRLARVRLAPPVQGKGSGSKNCRGRREDTQPEGGTTGVPHGVTLDISETVLERNDEMTNDETTLLPCCGAVVCGLVALRGTV